MSHHGFLSVWLGVVLQPHHCTPGSMVEAELHQPWFGLGQEIMTEQEEIRKLRKCTMELKLERVGNEFKRGLIEKKWLGQEKEGIIGFALLVGGLVKGS